MLSEPWVLLYSRVPHCLLTLDRAWFLVVAWSTLLYRVGTSQQGFIKKEYFWWNWDVWKQKYFKNILEHSITISVSDFHRPSDMILSVEEHMCQVYVFYVARIQKLKQESLMTILTCIVGCLFTFQLWSNDV